MESKAGMWNCFTHFGSTQMRFEVVTVCTTRCAAEMIEKKMLFIFTVIILKEQMYPGSDFTPNSNMSTWLSPTSLRILHPVIQPDAGICLYLNITPILLSGSMRAPSSCLRNTCSVRGLSWPLLKCGVWRRRGAEVQWWFLKTFLFFSLSLTLTLTNMGILFM